MTEYDEGLERTAANHQPMTPISYLRRTARIHPDHPAVIHGRQRHGYARLWADCCRLASALRGRGIGRGDTLEPGAQPVLSRATSPAQGGKETTGSGRALTPT